MCQGWKRLTDLNDGGVCEALVENVHVASELQGVDDEVFRSGGDLHQAGQPQEAPIGVVLRPGKRREQGKMDSLGFPLRILGERL